jgi:glycosyltransferase involved in cell wall biosynthesis
VRPKVLISAFSCNPERGSEPGVGHLFVSQLARHCDLTVIVEEVEHKQAIQRHQRRDSNYANIDFHYLPWPLLDENRQRITDMGPAGYYRQLRTWEQRAFALAKQLHTRSPFDLVHHLTMQGYREPGYLHQLNAPFIWGPVGGHAQMPWTYLPMLGLRGAIAHGLRNIVNIFQSRFHRRVHQAAKAARAVIVNTSQERDVFARIHKIDAHVIPEFGAESIPASPRTRNPANPLRIAWSGVHVPRKALPILLHAIARIKNIPLELHILSEGPETKRWKSLAQQLRIDHLCIWHGRLARSQALAVMSRCDVFALTSLIDGTSCVLNEAISLGLPVISHACCGFVDVVNDHCGILIPVTTPAGSAARFAAALSRLYDDATEYNRLAAGARQRASEIHRDVITDKMWQVYQHVLGTASSSATNVQSSDTGFQPVQSAPT